MRHTSDGMNIDHIALAILRRDGQIILVQQQDTQSDALYWVVPGGLVEPGELIINALSREVQEEAGMELRG
jgi:8-oxo-dGTP diphosphatase